MTQTETSAGKKPAKVAACPSSGKVCLTKPVLLATSIFAALRAMTVAIIQGNRIVEHIIKGKSIICEFGPSILICRN